MKTTTLRIAYYGCLIAFFGAAVVGFFVPGLVWHAAGVALVAGTAAGPIAEKLDTLSRG